MNTEVIISIIAVVVILTVIAYFLYTKDRFIPDNNFYPRSVGFIPDNNFYPRRAGFIPDNNFYPRRAGFIPNNIPSLPHTTPMQIAKQKGYSNIVSFLTEQHANTTAAPSIETAQETVYLINYATKEEEALNIIKTMYWPRVGASAYTSVPIQNYHPFGGLPTPV